MADHTGIEWTDASWNPVVGCSLVSPGCTNCYAMGQAARIVRCAAGSGRPTHYAETVREVKGKSVWTGKLALAPERTILQPLLWRRGRRIFVNSMGDLFHDDVPDAWIDRVFAVMALTPQHTYQVLTKRAARMRAYIEGSPSTIPYLGRKPLERIHLEAAGHMKGDGGYMDALKDAGNVYSLYLDAPWPLPNVWLGVSAEDQARADQRIPDLLATPAAIRFVSAEPLLGPIDLARLQPDGIKFTLDALTGRGEHLLGFTGQTANLDWIIVGGESGKGARPMHPDWARAIRDQCAAAGTAFFFKQWGEFVSVSDVEGAGAHNVFKDGATVRRVGKARAGRLLDGAEHNAMPEVRP